jgi:uncharacterized protein YcaQ
MLEGRTKLPKGKEGVARTIEALGYVQIDTISVVERAHHHTLWTRRPDYDHEMLHELQAKDRRVFEYWGHAASYLPMSDYRFYIPQMRQFENPKSSWMRRRLEKHGHMMGAVLDRIRAEGPLCSKDFEPPPGTKRGTWWDWKPAKVALELLFWQGKLMIDERRSFQRVYDLTERVLPESVDTRVPGDDELGRFLVRRALHAYGVAQEREIRHHIDVGGKDVISNALRELEGTGEVIRKEIEGISGASYYALAKTVETSEKSRRPKPHLYLLSPFDNLIIQRDRIRRLFGFDYALECYVPPKKRRYGYFTLPVLFDDEFVGRIDPKADRKAKTLIVRTVHLEDDADDLDALLPLLAGAICEYARFNRCEKIRIERTAPKAIRIALNRCLKSAWSGLQ